MNQEQTNITTGKQIRHLRTQLGMTQEELAGELNVTRQALSNWERDVNEPDLNMLKKIQPVRLNGGWLPRQRRAQNLWSIVGSVGRS